MENSRASWIAFKRHNKGVTPFCYHLEAAAHLVDISSNSCAAWIRTVPVRER